MGKMWNIWTRLTIACTLLLSGVSWADDPVEEDFHDLDASFQSLWSGGAWEHEGKSGYYRILVAGRGFERVRNKLYIQWIEQDSGQPQPRIVKTMGVSEFNDNPVYAFSNPRCNNPPACTVFEVGASHTYEFSEHRFIMKLDGIGKYGFSESHGRDITAELQPFVLPGHHILSTESSDLNGDGREDVILVLEKPQPESDPTEMVEHQRPFLILIQGVKGSFEQVKRNDRIISCKACGGMMGDPFDGVTVGARTFTVNHSGGSSWRWSNSYRFNYSKRDNTWQLVEVNEANAHASDPDTATETHSRPPADFGKIDITDFDPQNWKGMGEK